MMNVNVMNVVNQIKKKKLYFALKKEKKIMQSYSCFICKNHLIDPIVLKECQHSFCKICYKSTKSNIISLFEKFDPQKNRLV